MDTDTEHVTANRTADKRDFTVTWPEQPCWTPLEALFGPDTLRDFMAMGEVVQDEIRICLYKHRHTRRYLNVDSQGAAYKYEGSRYTPIKLGDAITHALS